MPSLIPSPYKICHIARRTSSQKDPDTGNNLEVDLDPVIRGAQSISQIGHLRGSSKAVITPEFVERIETELHIAVANPEIFAPGDQILLFPQVDQYGDYVKGSGFAFWVDGISYDGRTSPWPGLTKAFGGMVRVRRVS